MLNLDRAHGPSGRNDHVIGASIMVEISVLIGMAEVLCRKPFATPPHFDFPDLSSFARLAITVVNFDTHAWNGLAERTRLYNEVFGSRIVDEDHPHLGGSIHATGRHAAKCVVNEFKGCRIDRLARIGHFLNGEAKLVR